MGLELFSGALAATEVLPAGTGDFAGGLWAAISESARLLQPELIVLAGAIAVLLADICIPLRLSKELAWIAAFFCAASLAAAGASASEHREILFGMLARDSFSNFFERFFLFGSLASILVSRSSRRLCAGACGEYYFLLLSATFGAMLLVSSSHFLSLLISLEILSLSSYVLVGYYRSDRASSEAALKFAIYGAVASGITAYGLSVWFGLTGSAQLRALSSIGAVDIREFQWEAALAVLLALGCVFAGVAYKTALVPMQFWAPDAYQGAPTPIAAFLSVVSKGAGFAFAIRFFWSLASPSGVAPASLAFWQSVDWSLLISLSAALTMTLGNLAALWQTNLKRLLAYSSIAHAGYAAIGLAMLRPGSNGAGIDVTVFYLLAYLVMNLGAFAVVSLLEDVLGSTDLEAYRGLAKRAPLLSLAMAAFLFSLLGVPPTAGFVGKFQLFLGAIGLSSRLEGSRAFLWWQYDALVAVAAINTVISAYYYLRVVKAMYLEDAAASAAGGGARGKLGTLSALPGALVVASMLFLTIYLCVRAGQILLATSGLRIHV